MLIRAGEGHAHHDCACPGVDLGIQAGIGDQVDDPLLGRLLIHVQLLRQHLQVDALVYPAVGLKDEQAGILHKLCLAGREEEVIVNDLLTFQELLLGPLKVVLDEEALQELGDGVRVFVGLLLNDSDEVLQHVPSPLVDDHGHRQVPQ